MSIIQVTDADLRRARERFAELLANVKTLETDWQYFFSEFPFVFSRSLPLRLEVYDILPRGRPGKAEPDFIFYPQRGSSADSHNHSPRDSHDHSPTPWVTCV